MQNIQILSLSTSSVENATTVRAYISDTSTAITRMVAEVSVKVPGTYNQANDFLVYLLTDMLIAEGYGLSALTNPIVGEADPTPYPSATTVSTSAFTQTTPSTN